MLVRAAHSANIKERRDASTALFDARRRDGDAGRAHSGAPRRDARCGRRGARRGPPARATSGSSTTPTAAARTCPTSPSSRRCSSAAGQVGLRRDARASRRRRRRRPGQHAGPLDAPRPGGRGDPADPRRARLGDSTTRLLGDARRRACAARASARRTCARSWRPTGSPRGASSSSPSGTERTLLASAMEEVLDYAERRTRARDRDDPGRRATRAADVLEDDGRGEPRDLRDRAAR